MTNDGKLKRSYGSAKNNVECRSILLQWIQQQIALIKLELNQPKAAEKDQDGEDRRESLNAVLPTTSAKNEFQSEGEKTAGEMPYQTTECVPLQPQWPLKTPRRSGHHCSRSRSSSTSVMTQQARMSYQAM